MVGPNAPTSSSRSGQCSVLNCLHNSGIFAVEGFDSAVFVVRVARPAMCLGSARRDSGLRDIPTGLPWCAGAAARLLIGDDDDQVLGASLLQAVRAARPRQDCRTRTNDRPAAGQGELASAAQDVVDLVGELTVVSDRAATVEYPFANDQLLGGWTPKRQRIALELGAKLAQLVVQR